MVMDEYDMADHLRDVQARHSLLRALFEEAHEGDGLPKMPMPCRDDVDTIKEIHRLLRIPERPQEWPWIVGGAICGLIIGLFVVACFVWYYSGGSLG